MIAGVGIGAMERRVVLEICVDRERWESPRHDWRGCNARFSPASDGGGTLRINAGPAMFGLGLGRRTGTQRRK
jgi:hypothetical protein